MTIPEGIIIILGLSYMVFCAGAFVLGAFSKGPLLARWWR